MEALTGIDCDRWQEEKDRGITIDLGFAHLTRQTEEGTLQIGFVDVPGHERFVHNALAGLGGVRLMMLVVAADEGVAPQTREHLDICSLLDVPAGLVALTKIDLVDEETRELALLELEESLAGTPFESAPILPVSSSTREGLPELEAKLLELGSALPIDDTLFEQPARLPVDRVFVLKGLGLVTTGTLMSGHIAVGDTLERLPDAAPARVRAIQVHGEERKEAWAGERTSLQLTGLSLEELGRGHQLVEPEAFRASRSLLGRMRLLPSAPKPISGFVPIRFHLTSAEAVGKLRPLDREQLLPGEEALVEIRLDRPLVAIRGDAFIVRRPSPQTTLGGGHLLDPLWLRRRGASLARALEGLAGTGEQALLYWVEAGGEAGAATADLARRLGSRTPPVEAALEALVAQQKLLEVPARGSQPRRWLLPAAYRRVTERAKEVVERYFEENRLAHGMPKAEALRRIAPGRGRLLAEVYLDWLARQKLIGVAGDQVTLPGRGSGLSDEEDKLSSRITTAFEEAGLTPPSPPDICRALGAKPQIFAGLVKHLLTGKQLVRIPGDLILSRAALDDLVGQLRATGWSEFTVGQFKDRFGLTRKWAIPLLESLDQQRVTQRDGDKRRVLPAPTARN